MLKHEFTPGKKRVTINSSLYLLAKDSYVFQIEALTKSEKEDLEPIIEEINTLVKKLKKIDSKLIKFFNDMLYPFTKKITTVDTVNMLDLSASGFVCRHHTIDKLTPQIAVYKKYDEDYQIQPAILVYKSFLNDYRNHILTIIYLCDHFNEPKLRKEHENLWQTYKNYKTPIPH